jgi:hypothetical protein
VTTAVAEAGGLLDLAPFGARDDARLLAELERLSDAHLEGCPEFAAMWPGWRPDGTIAGLPFVHTQVFKHLRLRTTGEGIAHGRDITSSATSGGAPSSIALDETSSRCRPAAPGRSSRRSSATSSARSSCSTPRGRCAPAP